MLSANELYEIASLPISGFSTQRQFLAQVTEPQAFVNAFQELNGEQGKLGGNKSGG
jgi:hypothetical protein